MVRSDLSETELIVDGPHALDEKTGDQCMRDVFRHALVAEIVKMEIIACHQLQIGPGLGDEPHRIVAADVKNIFLGRDFLQAVADRDLIRVPG